MCKKIFILNVILVILFSLNNIILADDTIDNVDIKNINKVIETATEAVDIPKINSKYAIVLDRNSKAIIFGKSEKTKTKMASTTNIMTS